MHPPFAPQRTIRRLADVEAIERMPLSEAVPARSTYELLCQSTAAYGDRTALTFLPGVASSDVPIRWSYATLLHGVHQTANLLHRLGVRPDDAIAVLLPGCLAYHLALWGGEAAAIVQPLNPLLSDDKLAALMTAGRAKVLIAYGSDGTDGDAGIWSKAMRLQQRLPGLLALLRVAPHDEAAPPTALPPGVIDFDDARAAEADDRLVSGRDIGSDDIAAYFHTGGTTGSPKLARHSHGAQVFSAWASVQLQGTRPTDCTINGYPLFHVAGVLPGALTALSAGAETVIPTTALFRQRDVITHYWQLVERHRATILSAVPTVLAALANVPVDADISSLRYCRTGAAPLSPELAARFERLTGLHVHESLGMTEMAGISSITPLGVVAPAGCVGLRLPYAELRIVALDADGAGGARDLPPGETGQIQFRSPNLCSGFVDDADTARAFTADGWLATGDLGFVDADGLLHLAGRSKDLIIRSGHNIDPKVIEDALQTHPAVQLAAAVGAPDAYAGELPVAFVTLRPDATADEAALRDFAAAGVDEAPARPKSVTVLAHMPMTNVGKIYKPELRALAAAAVAQRVVDEVCTVPVPGRQPAVSALGDAVIVDLGPRAGETVARTLREALARLPFAYVIRT